MLSFTWDATYEGTPSSGLSRNSLDNEIRRITSGVRERMGREHNFGPFTDTDDGTHIPGKTTILLTGNAAARAAVSDMQEGALFLQDDGTNLELFLYTGAAWVSITDDVHGSMDNLTDDLAHEQYMLKDTAYVLEDTFDMNDQRLSTLAATNVPLVADHPFDDNPHYVIAYTAIVAGSIDFTDAYNGTLYWTAYSGTFNKNAGQETFIRTLTTGAKCIIKCTLTPSNGADKWQYGCVPDWLFPHIAIDASFIGAATCGYTLSVLTS